MAVSQLKQVAKLMKEYKEDPEAWKNACDVIKAEKKKANAYREVPEPESTADYIRKCYTSAGKMADAVHTMATVPVYVPMCREEGAIGIFRATPESEESFVPVFFSQEQVKEGLEYLNVAGDYVGVKVPLFLVVDDTYGVTESWETYPIIGFYDKREKERFLFANKYVIMSVMVEATRTIRSNFIADILTTSLEFFANEELMESESGYGYLGGALPVS